jgi:hypothetical protein
MFKLLPLPVILSNLKNGVAEVIKTPLIRISSKKASKVAKVISGLAVGILTACTLGAYGFFTYRYFSNRRVGLLQLDLEKKSRAGDLEGVKKLLSTYPILKRIKELSPFIREGSLKDRMNSCLISSFGPFLIGPSAERHILKMLEIASEEGNLEIVKLLVENPISSDDLLRISIVAARRNHFDVANYLIEKEAKVPQNAIFSLPYPDERVDRSRFFDFLRLLVEKMPAIKPRDFRQEISADGTIRIYYGTRLYMERYGENQRISTPYLRAYVCDSDLWRESSLLGHLARLCYKNSSVKCQEIMHLLIQKGDRLLRGEHVPTEAKQFIDEEVRAAAI